MTADSNRSGLMGWPAGGKPERTVACLHGWWSGMLAAWRHHWRVRRLAPAMGAAAATVSRLAALAEFAVWDMRRANPDFVGEIKCACRTADGHLLPPKILVMPCSYPAAAWIHAALTQAGARLVHIDDDPDAGLIVLDDYLGEEYEVSPGQGNLLCELFIVVNPHFVVLDSM